MKFVFKRSGTFGFDQRVNIKFKWDTRSAKFINTNVWLTKCLANFINTLAE